MIQLYGIRHHGPGCARSLLQALKDWSPDCLLIEGPPEAEAVLGAVLQAEMEPPVALLLYCPEDTKLASFYPFAEFSPEWQAIKYGLQHNIPVRLIDLPQTHDLALRSESQSNAVPETAPVETVNETPTEDEASEVETSEEPQEGLAHDPLDWLGRAAGYGDGETWWNQMVEERRGADNAELFEAIQEAMTTVRAEVPRPLSPQAQHREALREAHMRKCLRFAEKEGYQKIAVICGAWHVPALAQMPTAKSDQDLLKGLPKVKVAATWAPWTYGRLAASSGYGAGIHSPGWYEFLWKNDQKDASQRAIGWVSKVARLMRAEDIDCSSAHVIEAARLADTLAAMRDRPASGLEELNEAIRTVVLMGDDTGLKLVRDRLIIGERMGRTPPDVPTVPLQQDLERQQRSLRMKPEAVVKQQDLDLRQPLDLTRSQLLHRLNLIGVGWGEVVGAGRRSKGTFHEVWRLQWQPEFAIQVIEASHWGATIEEAATLRAADLAKAADSLPMLASLVDRVLLANLPQAVPTVTTALEDLAAVAGDVGQMMEAVPPLANIYRYGSVRQTDVSLISHMLGGMVTRACIGLSAACASLDDQAAASMRDRITQMHQAIKLIDREEMIQEWMEALGRLSVLGVTHGLVSGLAARLLFDEHVADVEATARRLSLALSVGNDPAPAAAWLEGFLHQSGMILLHDDQLWQMVNRWVIELPADHFTSVLPLVRRSFARFTRSEREQIAQRSRMESRPESASVITTTGEETWNAERGLRMLPVLRQILGLSDAPNNSK